MSYSRDDYPQIFDKSSYEFLVTMLRLMAGRLVTNFDIPAPCKHNLILTTPLPTQEYYSFLNYIQCPGTIPNITVIGWKSLANNSFGLLSLLGSLVHFVHLVNCYLGSPENTFPDSQRLYQKTQFRASQDSVPLEGCTCRSVVYFNSEKQRHILTPTQLLQFKAENIYKFSNCV